MKAKIILLIFSLVAFVSAVSYSSDVIENESSIECVAIAGDFDFVSADVEVDHDNHELEIACSESEYMFFSCGSWQTIYGEAYDTFVNEHGMEDEVYTTYPIGQCRLCGGFQGNGQYSNWEECQMY